MPKVLLTDNIATEAIDVFTKYPGIDAERTDTLDPETLKQKIADVDAIIVRSPTKLTADVIAAAKKLKFIGRAGVGTDNIDIDAATERGVIVMNSPGGNTVSTAEHTIAVMLALARHIPQAHASVTSGDWDRKTFRGTELFGKTLGIVGLGRVGREVARRMQAFEMEVIAADPYITADVAKSIGVKLVELGDVLSRADIISIHVPLGSETEGLLGEPEIAAMKEGVVVVNCARGGVVSESALIAGLKSGKVAAVGLDVYEDEPPGDHRLFEHRRSVFTPHLGAATEEAQLRVATDIAETVARALATGEVRDAVNRPSE